MRKRNKNAANLVLAAAAMTAWANIARADTVVDLFDTPSEASQWRFDYGGAAGNQTLSFSTDDAGGNSTSGSLDATMLFDSSNTSFAFTRDAFYPGVDGSQFVSLDADVKVVPGSTLDAYGNNGYFALQIRNGDNYDTVTQFQDNVKIADGWRHISVPLTAPVNSIRALTFSLYGGPGQNINGPVDLRLDNIVFSTGAVPGVERGGHLFSFEAASEIDPNHPSSGSPNVFGDSYGDQVPRSQSNLHPTDGAHSMRIAQPLNTNSVTTQVALGGGKFSSLTTSTKLLMDITTPGHGPGYQTLDAQLNFNGHYIGAYNANFYQFVDTNPGGDTTRTAARTQTYTWDFGGQMQFINGSLFPDLSNYTFIHLQTGNGGAAPGDGSPDTASQYFIDNVRVVNEDTTTRSTWQTVSTADWNNTANWAHGVPNGIGAPAIFYGIGAGTGTVAANATVTVNTGITVGSIVFDSQMTSFQYAGASSDITSADALPQIVNYTLSGTGSIVLNSGASAVSTSEIYAVAGSHTIAVPVSVQTNTEIDTSAGFLPDGNPSLPGGGRYSHVDMTALSFTAPITLAAGKTLTTHGAGTVNFAAINGASGGLVVNGGHANLGGDVNVGSLFIATAGNAAITTGGTHVVRSGSLDVQGALDIANNKVIVDYTGASPLSAIRAAAAAGYNAGAWTGPGINSTTAATIAADASNTHKTAVGFAEASALGLFSFAGQSVDGDTIVLRYTYSGDANLDGKVNAMDFNAVANNFGRTGKSWSDADFNYDGTVNMLDFTALASNFNLAMASPALGSLVPEPGALSLAVIGFTAIGTRRRRPKVWLNG